MDDQTSKPKDPREMGIPRERVEGLLACNPDFSGPGPRTAAGTDPAEVAKWWDGEKARIVNQIVYDLRKCELLEGNAMATEVCFIIARQLPTMRVLDPKGWRGIWGSMKSRARAKALQDLRARQAVPIAKAAEEAVFQERLKAIQARIKDKAAS